MAHCPLCHNAAFEHLNSLEAVGVNAAMAASQITHGNGVKAAM
jgi:hypothetical protein